MDSVHQAQYAAADMYYDEPLVPNDVVGITWHPSFTKGAACTLLTVQLTELILFELSAGYSVPYHSTLYALSLLRTYMAYIGTFPVSRTASAVEQKLRS